MPKVYIVNGSAAYRRMFQDFAWDVLSSIKDDVPDLVCFTGGEDVTPSLYGHGKHFQTYNNPARDSEEKQLFSQFLEADIPMVGICRGGQFLNVMNGGKMFQHVLGHTRNHPITDLITGESVWATSTHHQMMWPGTGHKLIAVAEEHGSRQYVDKDGSVQYYDGIEKDFEVVLYPNTRSLCFQPHPEFMGEEKLQKYFFSVIKRYLDVKG